jgi:hypothetical protein
MFFLNNKVALLDEGNSRFYCEIIIIDGGAIAIVAGLIVSYLSYAFYLSFRVDRGLKINIIYLRNWITYFFTVAV